MSAAVQWVRSILFFLYMYGLMALMGLLCAPLAIWSAEGARWAVRRYCGLTLGGLRWICGLRASVRGEVPKGAALIAAKHQSFLDVIMLTHALPAPRFIMKRSLLFMPIFGLYARRVGCIAIDRAAGAAALRQMVADIQEDERIGQVVIFPQGSRISPGEDAPYKPGIVALARALALDVTTIAADTGRFWPRNSILRSEGHAVMEVIGEVPHTLSKAEALNRIKVEIETASAGLATL